LLKGKVDYSDFGAIYGNIDQKVEYFVYNSFASSLKNLNEQLFSALRWL